jgi:hypothetical protein
MLARIPVRPVTAPAGMVHSPPMSRAQTQLAAIRKHLAKGMQMPAEFPAFVALVTSPKGPREDALRVGWSDPTELLNVDPAAGAEFVPFLQLADGGGVA